MIAPLAKFIDWLSIQKTFRRIPTIDGQSLRLEEALQFLKGADFIPAESQPAKVEFNPDKSGVHFRFSTPRPSGYAENNVVYGRFYRCGERWQERPTIILLHGGNMDLTPLNLTRNRPAIPPENILLIEATHDLFTPKEPVEELWHCWGKPHIWRFPLGHITKSLVPGLTRRVLGWLTPKMKSQRSALSSPLR